MEFAMYEPAAQAFRYNISRRNFYNHRIALRGLFFASLLIQNISATQQDNATTQLVFNCFGSDLSGNSRPITSQPVLFKKKSGSKRMTLQHEKKLLRILTQAPRLAREINAMYTYILAYMLMVFYFKLSSLRERSSDLFIRSIDYFEISYQQNAKFLR